MTKKVTSNKIGNIDMYDHNHTLEVFMNSLAEKLGLEFVFDVHSTENDRTGEVETYKIFRGIQEKQND